jgi:hypothetical protein
LARGKKVLSEFDAEWINLLSSVGMSAMQISNRYKYPYINVKDVLTGNSYSRVTGILNKTVTQDELTVVTWLLQRRIPYRQVALLTGIEANIVRNIKGCLQFQNKLC